MFSMFSRAVWPVLHTSNGKNSSQSKTDNPDQRGIQSIPNTLFLTIRAQGIQSILNTLFLTIRAKVSNENMPQTSLIERDTLALSSEPIFERLRSLVQFEKEMYKNKPGTSGFESFFFSHFAEY